MTKKVPPLVPLIKQESSAIVKNEDIVCSGLISLNTVTMVNNNKREELAEVISFKHEEELINDLLEEHKKQLQEQDHAVQAILSKTIGGFSGSLSEKTAGFEECDLMTSEDMITHDEDETMQEEEPMKQQSWETPMHWDLHNQQNKDENDTK